MKEKVLLLSCFFVFAPIFIFVETFLLKGINYSYQAEEQQKDQVLGKSTEKIPMIDVSVFASQEAVDGGELKSNIIVADARPLLIESYLKKYNSPLAPYSNFIFETSQKYGLDYRLIVAIAQQESNLCKKSPTNCFNCWGVGIHSRGTMCFNSYSEGIEWMARYLKEEYFDRGLVTPEQMMTKYCPLSNGSWAFGVNQFMNELE